MYTATLEVRTSINGKSRGGGLELATIQSIVTGVREKL